MSNLPYLVVSDGKGNTFEVPELRMVGAALNKYMLPGSDELIPLPVGSDLFELPGCKPVGYNPETREFVLLEEYHGQTVSAAAAFMAPAYMQLYRGAYVKTYNAPTLPLYAYTAVGWKNGEFYVTGKRVDNDIRQDLHNFDIKLIEENALNMARKYPKNRLVQHLIENCVLRYGCPAARNMVMERWESPIPTSPSCNANCVGCISRQPESTGVCSSQDRLNFIPTVDEIVEYTVPHLENAERAVVSFGQGCEGEPLMNGLLLEESIREMRKRTKNGVINLNSNGSKPDVVKKLFDAGLDSIRISLNSAQKRYYDAYFNPINYRFEDVIESLKITRHYKKWSSLNYFIFPGFTDHKAEIAQLEDLIQKTKINLIQARNLNMDPEWYIDSLKLGDFSNDFIGLSNWVNHIKTKFPGIRIGYFNPHREIIRESLIHN